MFIKLSKIVIFLSTLSAVIACAPLHDSSGNIANNSFGGESAVTFSKTVFPIINNNCAECHSGLTSAVAFVLTDPNKSQSAMLSFGLINLDNPEDSKIITKIANGHNDISTEISTQLSIAIDDWFAQLGEPE